MLDKPDNLCYNEITKEKEIKKMTKAQFIGNVILFAPLFVLNFFAYGVDGCVRMCEEMHRYAKKYLTNKTED